MNIIKIRHAIELAKQHCGRTLDPVELVAVSKGQPIHKIEAAILTGQKKFAENYLQEALPKIEALREFKLEWHFIGAVQRNKTRDIAENFAWVHSVDRKEIIKRLSEQRPIRLGNLNVCIQVNVVGESQKNGVSPDELVTLAKYAYGLPGIALRGLMIIPPFTEDFVLQRKSFQKLRELKDNLINQCIPLDTLSMGMSHDFEAAIIEGATIVRIGAAIFGKRR